MKDKKALLAPLLLLASVSAWRGGSR